MKTLKRILIRGTTVLAAICLLSISVSAETTTEPDMVVPDFPAYPAPRDRLSENDSGTLYFPSQTPSDFRWLFAQQARPYPMTVRGDFYLPETASADSPVPAIIILHGSGDIRERREVAYAKLLQSRGIAAFVIHSFAARGLDQNTPYLTRVLALSHVDIMTDAYAALRFLNNHPAIRHDRIGLLGFSYGGMATRAAIDKRMYDILGDDVPPFAVHIDFYGPCHTDLNTRKTTGAPYISVRGTDDASNNPETCAAREKALRQAGSPVDSARIIGAGHAWEFAHRRRFIPTLNVGPCELTLDRDGRWTIGDMTLEAPLEAPRTERIEVRREMVAAMRKSCMSEGYIMGRDDNSALIARRLLLQYVEMHLQKE
ncbi:dienelactone hydrolase family protein [Emcibacter sp.]|uniref:dienelactone hydrolase family protein n=1 Tax=Emcibacter sp. TaxID=1979954 RepID=UPI003A8E3B3F